MVHLFCPSPHLSISQVLMLMPLVVLKLFAVQGTGWTETDVPTLHSMSYFADTDAFMSLPTVFMQNINHKFQMLAWTDGRTKLRLKLCFIPLGA